MKNSKLDKFWAFFGGAFIGGVVAGFLKGDKHIQQNTPFMAATIGAYVGAAMMIAVYSTKWKPILALWCFWAMLALAIVWSA